MQELVKSLRMLIKLHESLYQIAVDKMNDLKRDDVERLDEQLKAEQSHLAAIRQVDRQREYAVQSLAHQYGMQETSPTVSDILAVVQDDTERKQLTEAREQLLEVMDRLQQQNELNQQLTYQSLQVVNFSLSMVRPPSKETMNYSKEEVKGVRGAQRKGLFDSQI